jgi:hypothetical protein
MVSADFTVNSEANPGAHTVGYGSTVALALTSISGASSVEWRIESLSEPGETFPVITPSGSPSGATASFPMVANPGDGRGRSLLVRVTVRGARGTSETSSALIGVANSAGRIPVTPGESTERNATHGWAPELNDALNGGLSTSQILALAGVKAAATANVASLSGAVTLDGIACVANDRVFLGFQSTQSQNGPWVVQSGAWTRPSDFNESSDIISGQTIVVTQGATYGGTQWALVSSGPFTLGTTALVWSQVGGSGGASAGTIQPVDVVATSNVNVSSPGFTTYDGVTLTSGSSTILLTGQSTASQNGKYLYNGSSSALTRTADMDADGDLRIGQQVRIKSGTLGAGTIWELGNGSTLAGSKSFSKLTSAADKVNHDRIWSSVLYAPPPSGDTSGATDYATLAALCATAKASGKAVHLQVGVYYINACLDLSGAVGVAIRGCGAGRGDNTTGTIIEYVGPRLTYTVTGTFGGHFDFNASIGCSIDDTITLSSATSDCFVRINLTGGGQPTKFVCRGFMRHPKTVAATSATSMTATVAQKTLTVSGGTYLTGQSIVLASRGAWQQMHGTVNATSSGTTLVVDVDEAYNWDASAARTDWDVLRAPYGIRSNQLADSVFCCGWAGFYCALDADGCYGVDVQTGSYFLNALGHQFTSGSSGQAFRVHCATEPWLYDMTMNGRQWGVKLGNCYKPVIELFTGDPGGHGYFIELFDTIAPTIRGSLHSAWTGGALIYSHGVDGLHVDQPVAEITSGYLVRWGVSGSLNPNVQCSRFLGTALHDPGVNASNYTGGLFFGRDGAFSPAFASPRQLNTNWLQLVASQQYLANSSVDAVVSSSIMRLNPSPDGPIVSHGLAGVGGDGILGFLIHENTGYPVTLKHLSSTETVASNRWSLPGAVDIVIPPNKTGGYTVIMYTRFNGYYRLLGLQRQEWQPADDVEIDNGNSGSTKTIVLAAGKRQKLTMTANCTLSLTDPGANCSVRLRVIQGASAFTLSTPTGAKTPSGSGLVLSGTAGAEDEFELERIGSATYRITKVGAAYS